MYLRKWCKNTFFFPEMNGLSDHYDFLTFCKREQDHRENFGRKNSLHK